MFANQVRAFRQTSSIVICLLLAGCAHDFYQQRADMIQQHGEAFNANLKADRFEAAIFENEQIEEIASQMMESIKKRSQPLPDNQVDREWKLLKTAVDAAVKNWLALGQRLTIMKKYDQARAAYQRVIETYTGDSERIYRERAVRAKRDLDILSPPLSESAPGS
jgi:tetratricopeptide (TPR) repeat protein